jgi:hypothetical protein
MGWYQSFDGKHPPQSADKGAPIDRLKLIDRNVMGAPALVRQNSRSDSASATATLFR